MVNYWSVIHRVLHEADILLIVLDARMISQTRNMEIEAKVEHSGKPFIYIINKSDLIDPVTVRAYSKTIRNCVFISAKNSQGTSKVRERIQIAAARAGLKGQVKVGVLGYPNVGKSSLINALSGKNAAPVSPMSGFTRGLKNVRATSKIVFVDTPGVIPYMEKDHMKHVMIGTIDYNKEKEPDVAVNHLMKEFPSIIETHYGVKRSRDHYKTIEAIAEKRKLVAKGGVPDVQRAAKMILKDWQTGKIIR